MCVANNPTEKHSSFALSPSSHTARQDFKGDHGDVDDNYFHHLPHTHCQYNQGKREMNGYYCTLPRNLSHRWNIVIIIINIIMVITLFKIIILFLVNSQVVYFLAFSL